jgi:hypothetical protein
MGVLTLLGFLVGDRQSILAIARSRSALWIGFIFVLSAGFAREYDDEDLLAEPWHLLLPLGASLASSLLLWLLVWSERDRERRVPFWAGYRSFLGLFWMMAPLAWLYAIPYERFLDAEGAITANLWTLATVAAWRVTLTVRILCVCGRVPVFPAVGVVMAFSSLLAFVAVLVYLASGRSAIGIMGGLREPFPGSRPAGAEEWILPIGQLAFLSVLPWMLVALRNPQPFEWPLSTHRHIPSRGLLALLAASLLVWVPILPYTQAEQRLRSRFTYELWLGRYEKAAAILNDHPREAFPPHWTPPPFPVCGRYVSSEQIIGMLEQPLPGWAFDLYLQRLGWMIDNQGLGWVRDHDRLADLVLRLPGGMDLIKEHPGEDGWNFVEEKRKALRELVMKRQKGK